MKILFVLKKHNAYGSFAKEAKSGLLNSARLTAESLKEAFNIQYHISVVIDANGIDREIHHYKPKYCIIEALFVTPAKLKELRKLHKDVKFIVRIHSKIPFLSVEGIAIEWLKEYMQIDGVHIAFNSFDTTQSFNNLNIWADYLPNIYSNALLERNIPIYNDCQLNIACFGAIRPLKNQLFQATCAMEYANQNRKDLNFHINSARVEQNGDPVLKNIRALFHNTRHTLIEHGWLKHDAFLIQLHKMDLGMQLSFTESFNIITADFVYQKVPIIVSSDISWMPSELQTSTTDANTVIKSIESVIKNKDHAVHIASKSLKDHTLKSLRVWEKFLFLSC